MSDVSSLAPWKFLSRKVLEWRELEMKRDPWQSTLGILKNSEGRSIVHSKEVTTMPECSGAAQSTASQSWTSNHFGNSAEITMIIYL